MSSIHTSIHGLTDIRVELDHGKFSSWVTVEFRARGESMKMDIYFKDNPNSRQQATVFAEALTAARKVLRFVWSP